jgi:hypothetical protein
MKSIPNRIIGVANSCEVSFLNIFSPFRAPSLGSHERLQMIADSCRAYIQDQLNSSISDPGVFEKLRWLTIYWNSTGAGLQPVVFPRS